MKAMLSIMLDKIMPIKKIKSANLLLLEILPALKSKYPINRLSNPHNTFIIGDDKPLPGGLAKGVGKLSPETP
jgi:hypothetical protein